MAALNHPHICTLHDVGPDYLVMEFVEGTPLRGPLTVEKAADYAGQILDALDAAHQKGIVHRDLKPQNILVTKQGVRTGKSDSENWVRLQSMIAAGVWRREPLDWTVVLTKSTQLIDRFGSRLKTGVLDTLHVADALHSGCTRFLSFDSDSNARALAVSCRLKVYPELTARERARVVK